MQSDDDRFPAGLAPNWEFRFDPGEPEPATPTEDQRTRLTQLQGLIPTTGHAPPLQHREELAAGLRALVAEGLTVDLLAVELRLPLAVIEGAAET
ncbi:hypothetical protein C5B85_10660 [Pseudoclavibacter sp. AY1F1]|uniref:hypothetical protein n=1 Tax=Pseudoclavibacter sp. AY1F1 TaxID=2080583 RepID=UPI000CE92252|nr:hypothetical protein [Pseudoclavibacter sp. AY1F1]PPF44098.1 hypothetical protein C5B85_10660 [Pseudoclavibacter sp. AY1F1]